MMAIMQECRLHLHFWCIFRQKLFLLYCIPSNSVKRFFFLGSMKENKAKKCGLAISGFVYDK